MHLRGSRSKDATSRSQSRLNYHSLLTLVLPSVGNVVFTLLVAVGLIWASAAGALPQPISIALTSTTTIAYQGRLADPAGAPISTTTGMNFRLYAAAVGGSALWTEAQTVQVTNGLFNVLLGSNAPIPQSIITGNSTLWLGIAVGADPEMTPRIQVGSVPYAIQALTVPDGSISSIKIANGAISPSKLSLTTGSTCLGADIDINLSGNWVISPIPGMSTSLTLSAPAKVLIIASGIAHFTGGNHVGTHVFLDGSQFLSTVSFAPNTGWQPFNIIRTVSLPAGNHTLDLRAQAQVQGVITYGGGNMLTCIQYIVYSE